MGANGDLLEIVAMNLWKQDLERSRPGSKGAGQGLAIAISKTCRSVAFRSLLLVSLCLAAGRLLAAPDEIATVKSRPNILFIVIDDLNDWCEPLGGHPQAKTPALRSLAERGLNFRNAHCQSPLCNSSRASVMTSLRPSTTGIYGLAPYFRDVESLKDVVSLPQFFAGQGYQTYSGGKVYHDQQGRFTTAGKLPEFQHLGPGGGPGRMPAQKLIGETPNGNNPWVDWGVFDHLDSEKGDWKVADWAEETISKMPTDKPFLLTVGFFLPHVPLHATQKWWDMYPDESLVMPQIPEDDLDDCPPFCKYLHWKLPEPDLEWLRANKQHRNLVRAYLAGTTFMDSQLQRVLAALEQSPFAKNTIVVVWSDHGWHLGEKHMTGKTTLWERSTHVPLIFAGPGITRGVCEEPVELLDIFPTLIELAGLTTPPSLEGISLTPQLSDPKTPRLQPAITVHNPNNFSLRDRRYRLIRYADGSEELYDLQVDPQEFKNLSDDPAFEKIADDLRQFVPDKCAGLAPGSQHRILEQREDGWYWEGQKIEP